MPKTLKDDPVVRINVILPESEREAFDRWCRFGGKPKMSMNRRIRSLIASDAAGKIPIPREASRLGKSIARG